MTQRVAAIFEEETTFQVCSRDAPPAGACVCSRRGDTWEMRKAQACTAPLYSDRSSLTSCANCAPISGPSSGPWAASLARLGDSCPPAPAIHTDCTACSGWSDHQSLCLTYLLYQTRSSSRH